MALWIRNECASRIRSGYAFVIMWTNACRVRWIERKMTNANGRTNDRPHLLVPTIWICPVVSHLIHLQLRNGLAGLGGSWLRDLHVYFIVHVVEILLVIIRGFVFDTVHNWLISTGTTWIGISDFKYDFELRISTDSDVLVLCAHRLYLLGRVTLNEEKTLL